TTRGDSSTKHNADDQHPQAQDHQQARHHQPRLHRLAQLLDDDGVQPVVDALQQPAPAHCTSPRVTFMKMSSRSARRGRYSTIENPSPTSRASISPDAGSSPAKLSSTPVSSSRASS